MSVTFSTWVRKLRVPLLASWLVLAVASTAPAADAKGSKGDDVKKQGSGEKGKNSKEKGKDDKPKQAKKKDEDKGKDAKAPDGLAPTRLAVQPAQPTQSKKPELQGRASDLVKPASVVKLASDEKGGKKGKKKSPEPKSTGNLTLLRECYNTLALGNRVYDGHRRAAMNQLDKAAQPLGGDFSGDGPPGREPQLLSDAQLTAVKALLEKGRGGFTGPALEHVDTAIKELGIALALPNRR